MTAVDVDLTDRHVLITGGNQGIGLSIARACRAAGANVSVIARSKDQLAVATQELAELPGEGKVLAFSADVSNDEVLRSAIKDAADAGGPIYGLVCSSGVYGAINSFADVAFADWERTITVNLIGTARTIHATLPYMTAPDGGRIVLFSGGGQGPMPHFSDYVSSKGAIWRLTETLGHELAPDQIFVNAIAPGAVNTRLLSELLDAGPERVGEAFYGKATQQRDQGGQSPELAAELTLFLLSPQAKGLHSKTLSAVWDQYRDLTDLPKVSTSDLFTYRRVVDASGNTRAS